MKKFLNRNKIIFFSPAFFGYENLIVKKLEEMGAAVYLIILRSGENLHKEVVKLHNINNIDYIFVIKGEYLSNSDLEIIDSIKCRQRILYLYDSIKRYPQTVTLFPHFDKILTFDNEDAKNYEIGFRPLFYNENYVGLSNASCIYDIASISSFYETRFEIFRAIKSKNSNLKIHFKLYTNILGLIRGRWKYYIKDYSLFTFNVITQQKTAEILASSRSILDIKHPDQNGLTIRTLETLSLKRKLITTNRYIKEYDFYKPQNILILEDDNFEEISDFIQTPYCEVDKDIIQNYSLDNFLMDIFCK